MSSAPKMSQSATWQQEVTALTNSPVDSHCVGVGESLEPESLLHLATDLGFKNICQKGGHLFDKEVLSSECLVECAENYLNFPIATILTPDDLSEKSERALISAEEHFDSSSQKRDVIDSLTKAVQSKGFSQTILDDVVSVTDEFFTNAIYNAPFVDINTHKNPGVSRVGKEIKLNGGKFGRIFLAHDESRLIVGCHDPYGSLDVKRYLNKIKATYTRGPAATMNFGPGGAGIGSYIIFNAGSSLYFGVWPGQATVLCCVLPLGMSNRKRIELPKHLHWIQR